MSYSLIFRPDEATSAEKNVGGLFIIKKLSYDTRGPEATSQLPIIQCLYICKSVTAAIVNQRHDLNFQTLYLI